MNLPSIQGKSFECKICKDTEWIYHEEDNSFSPCTCREKRFYERLLKQSNIGERFRKIGFKDFKEVNKVVAEAKSVAVNYVTNFLNVEPSKNNSIVFLGNPGSGKTYLSIAIANNLMSKNIGVLYMPYRETMVSLSQCRFNEENYRSIVQKYKNSRVLLIDDLFKGMDKQRNEFEVNTMFDIINCRYLEGKPMIISSEFTQDKLLNFDEALGSRIIEMAKGKIIEFVGKEFNYRLNF